MVSYPNDRCGLHPGKKLPSIWMGHGKSKSMVNQLNSMHWLALIRLWIKLNWSMLITKQPNTYVTSSCKVGFVNTIVLYNVYVGTKMRKFPLPVMDMPVHILGSVHVLAFFWIHYQNCTKLQGTNLHKLPVLVRHLKEEVKYKYWHKFCDILHNVPSHYRYWHHLMPVLVMYCTHTGTGQTCKNANTGTGTI